MVHLPHLLFRRSVLMDTSGGRLHVSHCNACRGADSSRPSDNPSPGLRVQSDPFTSPPKSDSIGSGVAEEGEIAAVLGRMLDQAGRMDAQAAAQVWASWDPS